MQSSPSKAAGRSGALGVRGAVVAAQQSCVRLTSEPRALVRLQRARARELAGNLVGYRALSRLDFKLDRRKHRLICTTAAR